jgi:hypothetical protein
MGMIRLRTGFALPRVLSASALPLAFAFVVAAPPLRGQTPPVEAPKTSPPGKAAAQAALPSARSILDRHLDAIGGKAAVLAHSSTHATGTFTVASAGMKGTIEVFAAKPDKSLVKINIPGVGEIFEGYDGTNGWTVSPMTGPMVLEGKQLEDKKFDTDFYSELHDEGRYASMTTMERTEFDGRPCYKIRLVRKSGSEDFEFYDVKTGLKAGRTATRETPMGAMTGTSVESDYKKFGKLLVPTTIKNSIAGVQQLITIETIQFDQVSPAMFQPPAEIKALIK